MASVQAAVMVEPGKIEVREFDRPQIGGDELLLKIESTGICGSDKHMYAGHMGLQFPVVPGHELVGTIEELGAEALERMAVVGGAVKEGDRITTTDPDAKQDDQQPESRQIVGHGLAETWSQFVHHGFASHLPTGAPCVQDQATSGAVLPVKVPLVHTVLTSNIS